VSEIRVHGTVDLRIKTERHGNGPGPTFTPTVSFEMLSGSGVRKMLKVAVDGFVNEGVKILWKIS
jgi:hypothetical protein